MGFKGKKLHFFSSRKAQRFSLALMLSFLLIISFSAMFFVQPVKADDIVHSGESIQAAINIALPGTTINVQAGTYLENIVIDKSITLIGADKETTIIQGSSTDRTVTIHASNVHISGFTITGESDGIIVATDPSVTPIGDCVNCEITGNIISHCTGAGIGIVDWSAIVDCSANTVSGNTIVDNVEGIKIQNSHSNTISGNTISDNSGNGVDIAFSTGNTISGNKIANNGCGLNLWGMHTETGIIQSADNSIYHNSIEQNTEQVHIDPTNAGASNSWDNGYPSGGNYWSDYTGSDNDGNGIGDIAYTIDSENIDRYPFCYYLWNTRQFEVDINGQLTQIVIETNAAITKDSSALNTLSFVAGGLGGFSSGYMRAIIPSIDAANLQVTIDGETVATVINTDGTNDYVFFQFEFSTHLIEFKFDTGTSGGSVFFNPPAINGKTVDINGGATPGDKVIENGIGWDWGDGTGVEQHYFPNSYTYASGGTYTVTVTAHYDDGGKTFTASNSVEVTVGEGIKSGGFTLTIDNIAGGGSVSYDSSLGPGTVPSGTSTTLYLAEGDPVWDITASPDLGQNFNSWTVSGSGVIIMSDYTQISSPVAILVNSDGSIAPTFGAAQMPSESDTIISSGNTATVTQTTTGVSMTISGASLAEGTSLIVTSVNYGGTQPSGTNPVIMGGAFFYDVQVKSASGPLGSDVSFVVTIVNSGFSTGDIMCYWDGANWVPASNQLFNAVDHTLTGTIPASALAGTPIAVGKPNLFSVPEYLYGALLAMVACFAAFFIVKRPRFNLRGR